MDRNEGYGEQEERQGENEIDQAGDDRVDDPAEVTGDKAQHRSDGDGEQRRHHADEQGDPGAISDPHENVAPEIVGSEQERATGTDRLAETVQPGGAVLVIHSMPRHGCEKGSKDGDQDDHTDDPQRDHRRPVLAQLGPRQLPGASSLDCTCADVRLLAFDGRSYLSVDR